MNDRKYYLIKWRGLSFFKTDWVDEQWLRSRYQEAYNEFNRKKVSLENPFVHKTKTFGSRIEDGMFEIDTILDTNAEKVLVKWNSLSVDDCSWEDILNPIDQISQMIQHQLDKQLLKEQECGALAESVIETKCFMGSHFIQRQAGCSKF